MDILRITYTNIPTEHTIHTMINVGLGEDIIRVCIHRNRDHVNTLDQQGLAPLHCAANTANLFAVRLLVDYGADLSLKSSSGLTPLHQSLCSRTATYDVCQLLLEKGANCNDRCGARQATPLLYALQKKSLEYIKLLLSHGADIAASDILGEGALHYAARNRSAEVPKFVLDQGIDVERSSKQGLTALHCAVSSRNSDICWLLIERGANVNRKCYGKGETPLTLAVKPEYLSPHVITALLRHGANIADKVDGRSVLEIAAQSDSLPGFDKIAMVLTEEIARMQCRNLHIGDDERQVIESKPYYSRYFNKWLAKFKPMERAKFYKNVSVFSALLQSDKIISGYARNEELVAALEEKVFNKYPTNAFGYMKQIFYAHVEKQRFRKSAAEFLNNLFRFNDPLHPIIQRTLDHLTVGNLMHLHEHLGHGSKAEFPNKFW